MWATESVKNDPLSTDPSVDFVKTKNRVITRRGVMWLGQTCNIRCHFCYFLDRINSTDHPEHPFTVEQGPGRQRACLEVECLVNEG